MKMTASKARRCHCKKKQIKRKKRRNGENMKKKFKKLSIKHLLLIYLCIWALSAAAFWLGARRDAMGYSLVFLHFVLPFSTFVLSIFAGKDRSFGNKKGLVLLYFGVLYMLAPYVTFSLANMLSTCSLRAPAPSDMMPGLFFSAAGMIIGILISLFKRTP